MRAAGGAVGGHRLPGGLGRTREILAHAKDRQQRCHADHGAAGEERATNADQVRQQAPDERADQIAGQRPGGQDTERPSRPLGRRLCADHHRGRRCIAADQTRGEAQRNEFIDVVGKPDHRHHDGHANRRTYQHRLAPEAVGELAPQGRGHGSRKERDAECHA
ncbi:hypothetical protein D3C81_1541850 [compost metagenome]